MVKRVADPAPLDSANDGSSGRDDGTCEPCRRPCGSLGADPILQAVHELPAREPSGATEHGEAPKSANDDLRRRPMGEGLPRAAGDEENPACARKCSKADYKQPVPTFGTWWNGRMGKAECRNDESGTPGTHS